ncbi:MAG: FAD-dependent oxidoreductase [Hyphomonadaceae bacterium]|nr:FAD-dependent oxidoreductase [Hyphomonadaceae bacterium]
MNIAIVGAGPAGFYTAEALAALCPGCELDLIERLPTPYGLIRSGVAPDHQTTKTIQQTFERIAQSINLRFIGNVEIDRDISLAELRDAYDVVVLSCGAPHDAPLDIPGHKLRGVYGATAFVGWYNGHPDYAELAPLLDSPGAVIIGNGNVAIDVARILAKSVAELASSDIAAHAMRAIAASRIGDIHIMGRRGPIEAKFTNVELRELGELEEAVALAQPDQIPGALGDGLSPRERREKAKNLECFRLFAAADAAAHRRRIRFQFYARPVAILGAERVQAVRFEPVRIDAGRVAGHGQTFDVPCGLLVSAIGYRIRALGGLPVAETGDRLANAAGKITAGLYVVGWAKRGPSGKIGTNRGDGEDVAQRIKAEESAAGKPGFAALEAMLRRRGVHWSSFTDWKTIEAAEIAAAPAGAPRRKLVRVDEMLALCAK